MGRSVSVPTDDAVVGALVIVLGMLVDDDSVDAVEVAVVGARVDDVESAGAVDVDVTDAGVDDVDGEADDVELTVQYDGTRLDAMIVPETTT